MALDAAVHPQDQYYSNMGFFCKEFFTFGDGLGLGHGGGFGLEEQKGFVKMLASNGIEDCVVDGNNNWEYSPSPPSVMQNVKEWDPNSPPEVCGSELINNLQLLEASSTSSAAAAATAAGELESSLQAAVTPPASVVGKRKRQRTRACKNKEELENQRMTHIAVERNRRKQMNDYLAVIRSLMPPSYVQRGDQASIIGGAINFVKELEQHLQSLEAQQKMTTTTTTTSSINSEQIPEENESGAAALLPPIFADFFSFPQYSMARNSSSSSSPSAQSSNVNSSPSSNISSSTGSQAEGNECNNKKKKRSALADIEVSMAESHANLKILSKKRPRQLLKLVSGLQYLWFTILHLNVTTTFDQRVLYSISVKLEEGCQLTTVDEIADAVNHLLGRIEEEAV